MWEPAAKPMVDFVRVEDRVNLGPNIDSAFPSQFYNKRVLITGGTGSFGTAFLRHAEEQGWNCKFTALARNESKIAKLRHRFPEVRCEIGDIRDLTWLETVFQGQDLIIHAAANKIVPAAENNVRETILTNVIGSSNVATAAVACGVRRVVGISTDKACEPTTIYGNTKVLMEGLFREANTWSLTQFITCRYGNVLKSNASIVPLFEQQIKDGKPFTITDDRMCRFWLTMPEAIRLVMLAALWPETGVVLVPKAPMSTLLELAQAVSPKWPIKKIGIRPGEKLTEKLIHAGEAAHTEEWGDLMVIHSPRADMQDADQVLPPGFEYTSEISNEAVPHLTVEQLRHKLEEWTPEAL